MRLDPVTMKKEDLVKDMLEFYMGKNTMERQNFIIENLVVEEDVVNWATTYRPFPRHVWPLYFGAPILGEPGLDLCGCGGDRDWYQWEKANLLYIRVTGGGDS